MIGKFWKFNKTRRLHAQEGVQNRDWAAVLRERKALTHTAPQSGKNWLQLGHAFKEAGYYTDARHAYEQVKKTSWDAPGELALQQGHLEKISGNLLKAYEFYVIAANSGEPASARTGTEEAEHLKLIVDRIARRGVNPSSIWDGVKVFLSSVAPLPKENDRNILHKTLGGANYSYAYALKGFAEALDKLQIPYVVLEDPTNIPDIKPLSKTERPLHIGFYPPEELRLLKGAYNITCFAWEFERLRASFENHSTDALSDQILTLNAADELWIPSQYGVTAISQDVSIPVTFMPAPVAANTESKQLRKFTAQQAITTLDRISWERLSIMPRAQDEMDRRCRENAVKLKDLDLLGTTPTPTIYLSVLNVHDYRKQLKPLLFGFEAFLSKNPNAYLLLKCSDPHKAFSLNRLLLHHITFSNLPTSPLISSRILLTREALTRKELKALFDLSQFYLCTSFAEGQNLPLIEAMTRGVVPVSVNNTAMADYIFPENSVEIPSHLEYPDKGFAPKYGIYGVKLHHVNARDVTKALNESLALSPEDYQQKSKNAQRTAQVMFGTKYLEERLSALGVQGREVN